MMNQTFLIRDARPGDAEKLIHVHFNAVHAIVEEFYPKEVLDAWSPAPAAGRYAWMREMIRNRSNLILVGEVAGESASFCMASRDTGFIKALYVDPRFSRQRLGKQLLLSAENQLAGLGVSRLVLNASMNAVGFYRAMGYRVGEEGSQTLSDGSEMKCCTMHKTFSAPAGEMPA